MRVAVWNIEWATLASKRASIIGGALDRLAPDLLCLSEAYSGYRGNRGYWIECEADYGYEIKQGRRKVMLWSASSWEEIDSIGDQRLPAGRFVSGVTQTRLGRIRVIGVCIPWHMAHVAGGRRDRRPWEDHEAYLAGLGRVLANCGQELPILLLGDFNQRLPISRAPATAQTALRDVLSDNLTVWTDGRLEGLDGKHVCHVAGSAHLSAGSVVGLPRMSDQTRLSDHDGLMVEVNLAGDRA